MPRRNTAIQGNKGNSEEIQKALTKHFTVTKNLNQCIYLHLIFFFLVLLSPVHNVFPTATFVNNCAKVKEFLAGIFNFLSKRCSDFGVGGSLKVSFN